MVGFLQSGTVNMLIEVDKMIILVYRKENELGKFEQI